MGMTVERTPSSWRQRRWLASLSKAASPSTVSQWTQKLDCCIAGANSGESLLGPMLTVAEVKKWLPVSQTTVNLVHERAD